MQKSHSSIKIGGHPVMASSAVGAKRSLTQRIQSVDMPLSVGRESLPDVPSVAESKVGQVAALIDYPLAPQKASTALKRSHRA